MTNPNKGNGPPDDQAMIKLTRHGNKDKHSRQSKEMNDGVCSSSSKKMETGDRKSDGKTGQERLARMSNKGQVRNNIKTRSIDQETWR
jgi:hypothetical protein